MKSLNEVIELIVSLMLIQHVAESVTTFFLKNLNYKYSSMADLLRFKTVDRNLPSKFTNDCPQKCGCWRLRLHVRICTQQSEPFRSSERKAALAAAGQHCTGTRQIGRITAPVYSSPPARYLCGCNGAQGLSSEVLVCNNSGSSTCTK